MQVKAHSFFLLAGGLGGSWGGLRVLGGLWGVLGGLGVAGHFKLNFYFNERGLGGVLGESREGWVARGREGPSYQF